MLKKADGTIYEHESQDVTKTSLIIRPKTDNFSLSATKLEQMQSTHR
jgi:hypothetical protein